MKQINYLLAFILILSINSNAQSKNLTSHAEKALNCSNCHSCEIPTKENPCLKACPRETMVTVRQKPEDGPQVITINKLSGNEDLYKEVIFTHRLHSEMSEMSGGCVSCHHYNPPGKIISCNNCHNPDRKRTDINRPDLKAAYHRQCMDCHREWSGNVDCVTCHQLNKSNLSNEELVKKAKEKVHPKVETPNKIKFQTPDATASSVTFFHKEHIELFNIECQTCHANEGCVKCHDMRPEAMKKPRTVDIQHQLCSDCHNTDDNCESCHTDKEKKGFNHLISTGFNLSQYHSKISCNRCHVKEGKFTGLKKECSNCHGEWTWDNFDHKVTKIILDEIHGEFECENCHSEKDYSKPTCVNCHDDITYPEFIPGKRVK